MKEIAEINLPAKTANDYEKDGAEFINAIKTALNRKINDRLTQILDNSEELIIKKSQFIRNERFVNKDYHQITYSYTIDYSLLVRCKDCQFSKEVDPGIYICNNDNIEIIGSYVTPEWYCADGKENDNDRRNY